MTSDFDDGPRGYGKPPKANRFKPGQSGNPRGRPKNKKSETVRDALGQYVRESVTLVINGKRKTMTRAELMVAQLVNKAANGDIKAVETIIKNERNAPAPSLASALAGSYERLAKDLRLIQERRKKRAQYIDGGSHQSPVLETQSSQSDISNTGKSQDGTGGSDREDVSTVRIGSRDIASRTAEQPGSSAAGGPDVESDSLGNPDGCIRNTK